MVLLYGATHHKYERYYKVRKLEGYDLSLQVRLDRKPLAVLAMYFETFDPRANVSGSALIRAAIEILAQKIVTSGRVMPVETTEEAQDILETLKVLAPRVRNYQHYNDKGIIRHMQRDNLEGGRVFGTETRIDEQLNNSLEDMVNNPPQRLNYENRRYHHENPQFQTEFKKGLEKLEKMKDPMTPEEIQAQMQDKLEKEEQAREMQRAYLLDKELRKEGPQTKEY